MTLHRASAQPLYHQVAHLLEQDIAEGRFPPYSRLMSESALMRRFDVSRVTVRAAIMRLVRKGLVDVRQGKGTFVAGPVIRHGLDRFRGLYDVLVAQGGQGHAQVPGGQHAQLAAQPPAGPPVVGHRDHRRQAGGDPPQRRQRGVQAVSPAQCDDLETLIVHSRPTSRWLTCTSMPPRSRNRPPICSAMATLRCLPPVQPTASVA